jgi:hypothetical protein
LKVRFSATVGEEAEIEVALSRDVALVSGSSARGRYFLGIS